MSEIIRTAMAEQGIFAESVPNAYRIQDVFGTSRSYCSRCHRVWSSHISWVKFDLRSQRVLKNWKQRCLSCSQEVNPYISADELERMAVLAIQRCQALTNGTFRPRSYSRKAAPHSTSTCEKCKYGRRPCWLTKQKAGSAPTPPGGFSPERLLNNMDDIAMAMSCLSVESTPPETPSFTPSVSPPFSPAVSPPMVPSPRLKRQTFGGFPQSTSGIHPSYYGFQPYPFYDYTNSAQSF